MPVSCLPGSCQEQDLLRYVQVLAIFLSVQAKAGAPGQQSPTGQQLHSLLQLIKQVLDEDGPTDHSVRGESAAGMLVLWHLTG